MISATKPVGSSGATAHVLGTMRTAKHELLRTDWKTEARAGAFLVITCGRAGNGSQTMGIENFNKDNFQPSGEHTHTHTHTHTPLHPCRRGTEHVVVRALALLHVEELSGAGLAQSCHIRAHRLKCRGDPKGMFFLKQCANTTSFSAKRIWLLLPHRFSIALVGPKSCSRYSFSLSRSARYGLHCKIQPFAHQHFMNRSLATEPLRILG